ncbi:MAG: hypothetical protein ACREMB_10295 [Candidatus Rokuibacteriota bacterium]
MDANRITGERIEEAAERARARAPEPAEDPVTETIERYTAALPSSGYLGVALAAMGLSLALQLGGRGKWGNFVAQWVPTWLIIGLYNKLVKLESHDRQDGRSRAARAVGISNRPLGEERREQASLPPRGQAGPIGG